MHIAVFSAAYGTDSAAALRWYWLAANIARNGAAISVFHNTPMGLAQPLEGVHAVYLDGPTSYGAKFSFRALARTAGAVIQVPFLSEFGHYVRSVAHRYRRTPWEDQALRVCSELHSRMSIDVIIGVCAPWSTAMAARDIGTKLDIPYLVEFQDPWKDYFQHGSWRVHNRLARSITSNAAALINVCQPWCERDEREFGKRSLCVPNGFEDSLIPKPRFSTAQGLKLGCVGSIGYVGTAVLEEFCQGLSLAANIDWSFLYVGPDHELVRKMTRRLHPIEKVKILARLDQVEALELLSGCDALVMFMHAKRVAHLGSKFSEYVAFGLPMILFGKRDEFVENYARRFARIIVCESSGKLCESLATIVDEKASGDKIQPPLDSEAITSLSWKNVSLKLLQELSKIIRRPYESSLCDS